MIAKKALFIGIDSAEPELLKQWSEDGTLPNLQKIWQSSIWGNVKIPKGFSNGAMWPSLFTGVDPSKHGRYNYLNIDPGTYNFKHFFYENTDYLMTRVFFNCKYSVRELFQKTVTYQYFQ